jgi:hypothetical protein
MAEKLAYVFRKPAGKLSEPVTAQALEREIRERLKGRPKGWVVRVVGRRGSKVIHVGPWRTPYEAPGYFAGTISDGRLGDSFTVRGKLRVLFKVKVIRAGLPEKITTVIPGPGGVVYHLSDGNDRIARVGRVAQGQDGGTHCNGLAFTRKVEGTNIWSQHSVFNDGCNAIDLTWPLPPPTGNDLNRQRAMVAFLLKNVRELGIHHIISERTHWEAPNFQPEFYGGVPHVSHTHVEAEPYHPEIPHGV